MIFCLRRMLSRDRLLDSPKWYMDFGSQFRLTNHTKVPAFEIRAVDAIDKSRRYFDFKIYSLIYCREKLTPLFVRSLRVRVDPAPIMRRSTAGKTAIRSFNFWCSCFLAKVSGVIRPDIPVGFSRHTYVTQKIGFRLAAGLFP